MFPLFLNSPTLSNTSSRFKLPPLPSQALPPLAPNRSHPTHFSATPGVMSFNFNRHNSVGGNWLPPVNTYNHTSPTNDSDPQKQEGLNTPTNNQFLGFRNPWYYSNQLPSLSSPTSTSHSPTRSHPQSLNLQSLGQQQLGPQPPIPLLQQQQAKRLSFANQLPITYENDAPAYPVRADNPFTQYHDVNYNGGPERRMSTAVDQPYQYNQAPPTLNTQAFNPYMANPYGAPNRRSSVATAGFQQHPQGVSSLYNNNYYNGAMGFTRSQLIVQYNQFQQSLEHQRLTKSRKPAPKLRKVTSRLSLKPKIHPQPKYRRCSVNSIHISPVNALSVYITESYSICQPKKFQYSRTTNPKRVLTKPLEPKYNNGFDNEDSDYILYVNDILGTEEGRKYIVLDLLGSGTFGQVVKCQNLNNQSVCAVKVVKSKPAYMNQSLTEVRLLEYLNTHTDGTRFIKLIDTFMHKEHLCLVFEILASNLYELVKQNQFQGLNMKLVKVLARQLTESMAELKSFKMIHCDLKPENILLCQPDKPEIKVIDFGSACFTKDAVYSYVQSRFYRSPEIILGLPYTESIDMWSLGCIVGELFLGLPLFPGTSEYNQIWKIADMLGVPPRHMIEVGKNSLNFFKKALVDENSKPVYQVKTYEEYTQFLKNTHKKDKLSKEQKNKNYFKQKTLEDIIINYKLSTKKMTTAMIEKEYEERRLLVDFLRKVLNMNPLERMTPQEALKHPFIKNVSLKTYYQN